MKILAAAGLVVFCLAPLLAQRGMRDGFGSFGNGRFAGHRHGFGNGAIYAYPVFIGAYPYGYPYAAGPAVPPGPEVSAGAPPAESLVPPEQEPGPETGEAGAGAEIEEAPYYLIAFKDHTVYAAEAYYVHGDTLHYLTTTGTHNQASLTLVDRDLTERLNRCRGVDLRLP